MDEVQGADEVVADGVSDLLDVDGQDDGDQDLKELTEALEGADQLPIEERLALLRRAEEAIAGSLEGLDGL